MLCDVTGPEPELLLCEALLPERTAEDTLRAELPEEDLTALDAERVVELDERAAELEELDDERDKEDRDALEEERAAVPREDFEAELETFLEEGAFFTEDMLFEDETFFVEEALEELSALDEEDLDVLVEERVAEPLVLRVCAAISGAMSIDMARSAEAAKVINFLMASRF